MTRIRKLKNPRKRWSKEEKAELLMIGEPKINWAKFIILSKISELDYLVTTAVRQTTIGSILTIFLYDSKKLMNSDHGLCIKIFLTKDDYINYDRVNEKWFNGSIHKSRIINAEYKETKFLFMSEKDNERIKKFFDSKYNFDSGYMIIAKFQENIKSKELDFKHAKVKYENKKRMIGINKIPKGVEKWLWDKVFDDCRYSFYKRIKKDKFTSFCTGCGKYVDVPYVRHKMQGICPNCKKKVVYRAIGKSKRIYDNKTIAIIEKTADGFAVRYYNAYKRYAGSFLKPELDFNEVFRIFIIISENNVKICSYTVDGYDNGKKIWRKSTKNENPEMAYVYTRNLKKVFKDTICGIEALAEMFEHCYELYPEEYIYSFIKDPTVEFFLKLGLYQVVKENSEPGSLEKFINKDGRSLRQILGINKEHLIMLQKMNAKSVHLETMKAFIGENIKFSSDEIMTICDHISDGRLKYLKLILKYCTIHRALKYLETQYNIHEDVYKPYYYYNHKITFNNVVSDWYDYIMQCVALGYDLQSDFVLFPKDLYKRHSELNRIIKMQKSKLLDKAISKRHDLIYSSYFYKNENLMIVIPKSAGELSKEGASLHHCVGRFSEKMAKGYSDILFIRNVKEPKKSYYTMEIKGMEILQCRGMDNCATNQEVSDFINEWHKHLEKKKKKEVAAIPYIPNVNIHY